MTQDQREPHKGESDDGPEKQRTGTFLGAPYDWRRPTFHRFKERTWNPDDKRLLTPKDFGWGWTVNLYDVWRRIRSLGRS